MKTDMRTILFVAAATAAGVSCGKGNVEWAGRESHPAVVNPVCGYPAGTVVVEVTNADASKRGSAEAYGIWGGILRTIEYEATPQVLMDDVWVRGDFDSHCAQVKVEGREWCETEDKERT